MKLPENLTLDDVADAARLLGAPADRTTVARALRAVSIRGVKEPAGAHGRWRLPRTRLHELVGAVLLRREARKPGRGYLDPETFVWLAAQSMLSDDELAAYVPRRLKAEILEQQRLEVEERARAERRARREKAAAERRAREQAERREFNRVRQECYWRCHACHQRDHWRRFLRLPSIPKAEQETFDHLWPQSMPGWWLPPPEMHAAMRDFLRKRDATSAYLNFDDEVPDWDRWMPAYAPGAAWPWRRSDDPAE